MCEGTGEPCENDADCSGHYKCGVYEQWNDLQKYYYNMPDTDKKRQFTNNKQWDMIGCGIDLNYSDGTSGENVCKDKYLDCAKPMPINVILQTMRLEKQLCWIVPKPVTFSLVI